MRYTVHVTAEHIAEGTPHDGLHCPVALALCEALGVPFGAVAPGTRVHKIDPRRLGLPPTMPCFAEQPAYRFTYAPSGVTTPALVDGIMTSARRAWLPPAVFKFVERFDRAYDRGAGPCARIERVYPVPLPEPFSFEFDTEDFA